MASSPQQMLPVSSATISLNDHTVIERNNNNNMMNSSQPTGLERDAERAVELLRKLQQTEFNAWADTNIKVENFELLEKLFSSELFKSVTKVYDQIYDTVNISGSADIKAEAAAKATVAVFSASLGHSHPRVVELPKNEDGLGFNVMTFEKSPIYISRITQGGVADRHGGLRRGDQLISINGINVENEDHTFAVELLKQAKGKVVLVVKYMPGVLNQMEATFRASKPNSHK